MRLKYETERKANRLLAGYSLLRVIKLHAPEKVKHSA
jgi:hypothetical protein